MFSKNLILAGILAASLASANTLLSTQQEDTIYSLPESVEITNTRSLRAIPEPTEMDDATTWTSPTHETNPSAASTRTYRMKPYEGIAGSPKYASQCNHIGQEGGAEAAHGSQLLNLDVIVSLGVDSIQACCNACARTKLCIAFTFRPLLCVLARLKDDKVAGQPGLNDLLSLTNV
ncbi:unnamed protein product [Peronospora belbahrii]|uniref:Apple domain-containing protein n=2 Tax=Peronospora belbahrii TaxID=622444 RepID=A0AAU9L711_9STRA|nr:unnamed protein product [Peronospora belbahrii]CAH0479564.1 unnamed protein product [Peronospora belbahrii]CAH0479565.1 unnamed protein product [Peronospora belbahrii]CAH0479566.1 unnamed protein product [Peronospora belbahrii]CAH0479567.1 unnamed protein product [Peronospora belbahrii]